MTSPYLVIDASASLKWALDDEDGVEGALALLDDGVRGSFQMVAPSLWLYEVGNGLVTAGRRGRISTAQGAEALHRFTQLGVRLADPEVEDCYRVALQHRIALYDAAYLVLAEAIDTTLWTGDRKLLSAVGRQAGFVHWIGTYPRG